MNFKLLFSFVLSILCVNLAAQDFEASLCFEDSTGKKDTLEFGNVNGARNCLDSNLGEVDISDCLLYTSPSPRDKRQSRMPSSA